MVSSRVFWQEHDELHAGGPYKWWTLTDLHHYWGRPPLRVEDADVEVGDEHEDPLILVGPAHPDVMEL